MYDRMWQGIDHLCMHPRQMGITLCAHVRANLVHLASSQQAAAAAPRIGKMHKGRYTCTSAVRFKTTLEIALAGYQQLHSCESESHSQ